MIEARQTGPPDEQLREAPSQHVAQMLSPLALASVGLAAQAFYGAEGHAIHHTPDTGEYHSVVAMPQTDREPEERAIGSGQHPREALQQAYEGMRSLEKVQGRALVSIKMTDTAAVDFSSLEHYAPKMAPTTETYAIPGYLKDALTDSSHSNMTYRETTAQEGWDTQLAGFVSDYLATDPRGQELMRDLKIIDLKVLTPEQAVKLSLSMVQNLSKYSRDETGVPDGKRADAMTTMQLLQEGAANKDDPQWQGNGVCRNVASNAKAVFEALKMNQGELSMLNNTYAVYDTAVDGEDYDNKREDVDYRTLKIGPEVLPAHAWVKFVTVNSSGAANIAITDPTWALEADASVAVQHMDYTLPRMAKLARELFAKSDHKKEAFYELNDYYRQLIRRADRDMAFKKIDEGRRTQVRQFAMTEYLKAAELALPEFGEQTDFMVPDGVAIAAFQLKDKLQDNELDMLYKLAEVGSIDNFDRILGSFAHGNTVQRLDWQRIQRLVKRDDKLQAQIFTVLGEREVAEFANKNGMFRARLRGLRPETLPRFDPETTPADIKELRYLAERSHINESDPKAIMRRVQRGLRAAAGSQDLFEAATYGRSDYELVKHYDGLRKRLAALATPEAS